MKSFSLNTWLTVIIFHCFFALSAQAQTLQWAKKLELDFRPIWSIESDASGNIFVAGNFQHTIDFDPGPGQFNLSSTAFTVDAFVAKYTSSGNFLWAKKFGGKYYDEGLELAVDGNGNVYFSGVFIDTVDFDPGPATFNIIAAHSTVNNADIFITKLDGSGNLIWAKSIGSTANERVYSLALDANFNVYTTGYFNGAVDFDPGAATSSFNSGTVNRTFISKLDSNGDFVWAREIPSPSINVGRGITIDKSGNVCVTGYFFGSANFTVASLTSTGTPNSSSVCNEDVLKYAFATHKQAIPLKKIV
jgi:hypothetical protein